jgi:hypothetical protein
MDIGEIIRRVWAITWRFKGLWVLGILAGCSLGGGGGGSSSGSGSNFRFQFGPEEFPGVERWFDRLDPGIVAIVVVLLICLALLMVVAFIALGVIGQASLIAGFDLADEGHHVTLGVALQRGMHYFWKVLAIQVVLGIIGALAFGATFISPAIICLWPMLCVLVAAFLLFGVYVMLAQVALVVEELDFGAALSRSWQVLRENLGTVIVLWLILVVGGGIVGFVISLPVFALVAPILAGLAISARAAVAGTAISVIGFLILLPLLILANGIVQTFTGGAWTIAYRRMIGRKGTDQLG